ncbi:FAD/NAD(P)-binding domain-containing protein [Athelia psychrophila]|uniref:FAD/NAD(P)-binding domain-containing protein n=1 Tax=Athelia psychrophila TaxID=1759441 RepID=A0A167U964_9AGAM|nr:FAD/NAD(P)-binding domain-containing protein [Fibularhizoctonia sp. CBS 109695]
MTSPKVLIIGGGLGGLTLAQSLRYHGIDYELFERDEGPQARVQGWAVALQCPSACLWGSQSRTLQVDIYDAYTGESIMASRGIDYSPGTFIRVNRVKYRQYLLIGLDVQWGHRFSHHEVTESGGVKAFFEDGSTAVGDILVGADGLRSRARCAIVRDTMYQPNPPVLNTVPTGIIIGEVTLNREQCERQAKLGRAFHACIGKDVYLFTGLKSYSSDLSEGYFYWLFFFAEAQPTESWINTASKAELLSFVKGKVQGIYPALREIVDLQKVEEMGEPFVLYDRVPEMCPAGPVTLIGDATHPMTPLRGEGANNAMRDSVELGMKLSEAIQLGTSLAEALRAYEAVMIPRATQSVLLSRQIALNLER